MTNVPDTPFVTGETFEQQLANAIWVTPTGGIRMLLADALAAAAGGTVTEIVAASGPFLSNATITASGTVSSSSASLTSHGVVIAQGVSAVAATAALSSGQILVGQSGADPLPKTMGGDATINNLGQLGLVVSGVTAGTYGDATHVGQFQVDNRGIVLSASAVAISATSNKLTGTFTANGSIATQLPALANIVAASFVNTTTIAVVVGIGTTSGATDIMDATTIAASDITPIPSSAFLKLAWLANQTIFVDSASWGGASVNVSLWYAQ
jgi:hypothetical protein